MLCFQLSVEDDTLGALNLYAGRPHGFDEESAHVGLLFASHAAVAYAGVRRIGPLLPRESSREVISQAQGILMERHELTADRVVRAPRPRQPADQPHAARRRGHAGRDRRARRPYGGLRGRGLRAGAVPRRTRGAAPHRPRGTVMTPVPQDRPAPARDRPADVVGDVRACVQESAQRVVLSRELLAGRPRPPDRRPVAPPPEPAAPTAGRAAG